MPRQASKAKEQVHLGPLGKGREMTAVSSCQKTCSRVGTNRRGSRHVEPGRSELVEARPNTLRTHGSQKESDR